MARNEQANAPELRGRPALLAFMVVVIALVGGSWWGWSYAGPLGGLLGVLIATAIAALAFTILRARASAQRFVEPPAPDVRELPPDQALQVLTAMMTASASASGSSTVLEIRGGLLGELNKARKRASEGDLDGALAKLRALAKEHPRSPAVPAAIAEVLAGQDGHESERQRAATQAITLATHGGMNRLAARVYTELDAGEREQLRLESAAWERLAKIFSAQNDERTATALRDRAQRAEG